MIQKIIFLEEITYFIIKKKYGQISYGINRMPSSLPTQQPNITKIITGATCFVFLNSDGKAYGYGVNLVNF